jgi:hypothetical protein
MKLATCLESENLQSNCNGSNLTAMLV